MILLVFFFFKQKTAYEMRISDWSSDVCSSDLTLSLMVSDFLSRVCVAYVSKDVPSLKELCQADKTVDDAYAQILDTIIIALANHPDRTSDLTQLLFCIKNMDRIGDHISHIAQTRYLALTGVLPDHVKHHADRKSTRLNSSH